MTYTDCHPLSDPGRTVTLVNALGSGWDEFDRHPIDAIAQTGWLGAVVKDVALMPITTGTVHFRARIQQEIVGLGGNHVGGDRLPEARPTRSAVELVLRRPEREVASRAGVGARSLILMQGVGEGPFRPFLSQNMKLFLSQAPLPLLLGLGHFHDLGWNVHDCSSGVGASCEHPDAKQQPGSQESGIVHGASGSGQG